MEYRGLAQTVSLLQLILVHLNKLWSVHVLSLYCEMYLFVSWLCELAKTSIVESGNLSSFVIDLMCCWLNFQEFGSSFWFEAESLLRCGCYGGVIEV